MYVKHNIEARSRNHCCLFRNFEIAPNDHNCSNSNNGGKLCMS